MESCENLFTSGKFSQCSRELETLLDNERTTEGALDVRFSFHIQHNKIVSDALSYNWFENEANLNESHLMWCDVFMKLAHLCDSLRCDLLTSNASVEVYLVATLNLLMWSWENLEEHFNGYLVKINELVVFSLQTELSSCGESALETEDVLDLVELYQQCLWKIPPQRCNVLFDMISLLFLHKLRFENSEQVLSHCLNILEKNFEFLPQIQLHLTSGKQTNNTHLLFRLGPNIASSDNDPKLSINLIVIVTILYLLKLKLHDKAWGILSRDSFVENKKLEVLLEYLKVLTCLRRNDLDRSLYHIKCLSAMPMDAQMIKRKNILNAWLHICKANYHMALEFLRDSGGFSDDEDQLPIHVFLMGHAYGAIGQPEQQLVLLDCVVEVLREDPKYASSRVTPISSVEDRLLCCLHQQPDLTLSDSLLSAAEVSMKISKPAKACEYLLDALRLTKCSPHLEETSCDFVKARSLQSVMRDAIVALLKCGNLSKAQILCRGLMEPHMLAKENFFNQAFTWILSADIEPDCQAEKKQEILLKAAKLLKKHKEAVPDDRSQTSHCLTDSLLARTFYRKAKLYASSGFQEDATGYFKRALALKKDDDVILREYQRHLFMTGKSEEAREIHAQIKALSGSPVPLEDINSEGYITLNYLVHEEVADGS